MVNMLRIVNHIGTTSGSQGNHLKFPIDVDPRGPYKNHLIVKVDTGADVNCMNEKTFRRLFPKVKLSVCPHEIQNFENSTADISILGQFHTYLQFRGEKYLTTFIVTNADDCPNLLSHGATFRMGVLLPNYPEENVVKGETGTISNVFQILRDLRLKQYLETSSSQPRVSHTSTTNMACTTTQLTPLTTYGSTPASQNTGMATPITSMSELSTVSRTTMPADTTPSSRQQTSQVRQNSSHSGPPIYCMHVHQPQSQACKPGEPPALRKVKIPHNGKTSMNRSPLAKQEISSQFSSCSERIGHFPGDPCQFHLKPDHQLARHASKKQGIPEEVNEHADWVHSNIFVEKALEREPYYTHSTGETTTGPPGRVEHARHFPTHMEMCMDDHFTQATEGTPTTVSSRHQPCRIPIRHGKHTIFPREAVPARKRRIHTSRHGKDASLPRKPIPARKREKYGYRYIYIREHYSEQVPCTQYTHTSGYRARKSSTELPATEDGKFQHGGTSMLQLQC